MHLEAIAQALELLPDNLSPLDVCAMDGFMVGVALLASTPKASVWWPKVLDPDESLAKPLREAALLRPEVKALQELAQGRLLAVQAAIDARQWFDPWVFEWEAHEPPRDGDPAASSDAVSAALFPWVAGFATAMHHFPAIAAVDAASTNEPLALLFLHLDPDDLEDADALLELMAELEPPETLSEGVEDLVTAVLRLADVSRPRKPSGHGLQQSTRKR